MPKFRIKKKRKKAKASAKASNKALEGLGVKLDEKKLFKQELQGLKAEQAKGQARDLEKKARGASSRENSRFGAKERLFRKAQRKRKKADKHTQKMFKA
jgi:hypothetical protein|tara:strand:+ start:238 stop:534 length:297 start_codon:yes stop_codon:yes gene_type:complete